MKAKCTLCGKTETISKLHKDYKKFQTNPSAVHICETCSVKLGAQAKHNLRKSSM